MDFTRVRRSGWAAAALAAGASMASVAAQAAQPYAPYWPSYGGLYLGASVGEAFYNEEAIPELNPSVAMFRIGQQFSPFFAIEGRLGGGLSRGSSEGYHADLEAVYGGYLKGMLPVNRWLSPYAIAGVGGEAIHRNYADYHSTDAGFSFGGGLELNMGGGASINVEWVRLISNGDNIGYGFNTDLLTLGFNWHPYLY